MRHLHEAGRASESLTFSLFLTDLAESPDEKADILRLYINDQSILCINRANACLELGGAYAGANNASEAEKFLRAAENGFEEVGYVEGEWKVRLKRLGMMSEKGSEVLKEILDVAQSFANISSVSGQLTALGQAEKVAFGLHPQTDYFDIHDDYQRLCTESGNECLKIWDNFSFASALITWPNQIGKAVETLRREVDASWQGMPVRKGQMAIFLAAAYIQLGDQETAITYSKLAVEAFRSGCKYKLLSNATWTLATAMTTPIGDMGHNFDTAIQRMENSVELDREHDYLEGQTRSFEMLASLEGMLALARDSSYHAQREEYWTAERLKVNTVVSRNDAIDRINAHITHHNFVTAEKLAKEALQTYSADHDSIRVANCEHCLLSCYLRPFDASSHSDTQCLNAWKILHQARRAMAAYKDLGTGGLSISFIIEVSMAFEELVHFWPERKNSLCSEALNYLELGDSFCENMRSDLSSSAGLASLLQKRIFVGYKHRQEIYTRALRLAAEMNDVEQLWKWTQKAKGKALADMIASRALSPDQAPMEVTDDEAISLMEEESRLMNELQSCAESDSLKIRMNLDQVRSKMEKHSALGHLLRSRAGKVELQDLGWIFEGRAAKCIPGNGKIVIVEWIVIDDSVIMLTVDASLKLRMMRLAVTSSQVLSWKRKNWKPKELGVEPFNNTNSEEELEQMKALIDGLEQVSAENDHLVLCPSGPLHGIPLHSLRAGDRMLIDRNFISYCTSLSSLRLSLNRAAAKARTKSDNSPLRTTFFAVFDSKEEREKIYKNVTKLADQFGSAPNVGADASRENFQKRSKHADIIHFHGHTRNHENVLYRSILLDGTKTSAEPVTQRRFSLPVSRQNDTHVDAFTIGDFFDLHLNASLTTVIACSSGVQDVAPGDEPLGFLEALAYAGSATSIGTLWPVMSHDGRDFSTAFFEDLCRQKSRHASEPLNLAVSFRNAVLGLKKAPWDRESFPYNWASFVMHGSWFL